MVASKGASEQGDAEPKAVTGLVPGVDWPKALLNLKRALRLSWRQLASRLGVGEDQVSRLRRGQRRAGFVLADRILGLSLEEGVLVEMTEGISRSGDPRPRFRTPLPLHSNTILIPPDDIEAATSDK